jgi:hypothetical protein
LQVRALPGSLFHCWIPTFTPHGRSDPPHLHSHWADLQLCVPRARYEPCYIALRVFFFESGDVQDSGLCLSELLRRRQPKIRLPLFRAVVWRQLAWESDWPPRPLMQFDDPHGDLALHASVFSRPRAGHWSRPWALCSLLALEQSEFLESCTLSFPGLVRASMSHHCRIFHELCR